MRRLQKSKKLSWASDVNLCQVRLFLSDESPSQVGLGTQDHLQAKASWLPAPTGTGADDNFPPGFEGAEPANLWRNKLSQIPLIKWRCPPRFLLDLTWQAVSGEESKEVEIQNQREMRVLEAVYPRPSAIPPNSSLLPGIEDSPHNDFSTPLIPITPLEDEDGAAVDTTTSVDTPTQTTIRMSSLAPAVPPGTPSHPNPTCNGNAATGIFPGVEADVAAAAYAALTAIMASNDQGSLIDQDLLIRILRDRDVMEKLIADHRATTNCPLSRPLPGVMLPEGVAPPPSLVAPPNRPLYPPPNRIELVHNPASGALVATKDINYYKSLIQQHGEERRDNPSQFVGANLQEFVNISTPRDLKHKIMKPCIYFNSSRGCHHGANCFYQHDVLAQQQGSSMPEPQSAKRTKLDREITGV